MNKETEISIPHHQEHYDYRHQDIDEDYQQEDFGVYQGPINDEYNEYNSDTRIYPGDDFDNAYVDQGSSENFYEDHANYNPY